MTLWAEQCGPQGHRTTRAAAAKVRLPRAVIWAAAVPLNLPRMEVQGEAGDL